MNGEVAECGLVDVGVMFAILRPCVAQWNLGVREFTWQRISVLAVLPNKLV